MTYVLIIILSFFCAWISEKTLKDYLISVDSNVNKVVKYESINRRYALIIAVLITIGILCFHNYGFTAKGIYYYLLFVVMALIGVIDYTVLIIPNILIGVLLVITLVYNTVYKSDTILINIVAALIISVVFLLINYLGLKLKDKKYIGEGDIKLIFTSFIIVDFPISVFFLWVSSVIGLAGFYLLKKNDSRFRCNNKIPFGMFLAIGLFITIILFDQIHLLLLNI